MTAQPLRGIQVAADLRMDLWEGTTCVQTLMVSSQGGGPITLAFSGTLPRGSWKQLRGMRMRLSALSKATGQELRVTNEGKLLVSVLSGLDGNSTISIRWWAVLKQFLLGS